MRLRGSGHCGCMCGDHSPYAPRRSNSVSMNRDYTAACCLHAAEEGPHGWDDPRSLARTSRPAVPITGSPRVIAMARAARSSRSTAWALSASASAITSASPQSRRASSAAGTDVTARTAIQVA